MKRLAICLLAVGCLIGGCLTGAAHAASEADCAAEWTKADVNHDGVLAGVEANQYLAYIRIRAQVAPWDGRITQDRFMEACKGDLFKSDQPEPGAPLKGANSFTESQAKDRAIAAGFTELSALSKDDHGIWRGKGKKDERDMAVAIDFKGNVVSQ